MCLRIAERRRVPWRRSNRELPFSLAEPQAFPRPSTPPVAREQGARIRRCVGRSKSARTGNQARCPSNLCSATADFADHRLSFRAFHSGDANHTPGNVYIYGPLIDMF
jgi:hypothetical protein